MFSCFLLKPAHFPHVSLLTSHLISGIVLKVEQETIISLSTSFPLHFWSCRIPFQIKTTRKITVNWCLKPWFHDQQFYILTSRSTHFSVCLYLCVCAQACVCAPTCLYPSLSFNKADYFPGNKDCQNPEWLLGKSILWSKNLRTLHFEMMPNAVRTAQVFSHVKRISWLCLTDHGKAQTAHVLT